MSIWPFLGILACLGLIAAVQYRGARQMRRPLSTRQPERRTSEVPLGYEGLNLDEVSRTNRRNESLERGQTNWLSKTGFFGRPDTDIPPLADDETYATRFHAAFHKEKPED